MRAIVQDGYGSPDVLRLKDIDTPSIGDGDVLVRVHAAGLNAGDYFTMRGVPVLIRLTMGLRRPRNGRVAGWDVAGRVEAVGSTVTRLRPGDEVFGACGMTGGALAEYACLPADRLTPKPADLSFEQAAAVPTAAATALRALRDVGKVGPGQKVLVNGASGGVARSPCRSASGWEQKSPASAAPGTSIWCARLAPTTSSTTRRRTSRRVGSATTSSSTMSAAVPSQTADEPSRPRAG
jgi:NADPH:quinone reductase-like Zn-dependent oxidoreductase